MAITGEQIRRERKRRRLTQQQLADAAGVSLRTVGRIERGESDSREFDTVAAYLGLRPLDRGNDLLLRDASIYDCVARIVELYEDALRRSGQTPPSPIFEPGSPRPEMFADFAKLFAEAIRRSSQNTISYEPGAPAPGLVAGPSTRTTRLGPEAGDAPVSNG